VPERVIEGAWQESGAILISFLSQWNFFIFHGRCDFSGGDGERMATFSDETSAIGAGLIPHCAINCVTHFFDL
jgi:hypothetical protein